MRLEPAKTVRRSDYLPPAYLVSSVTLVVDLDPENTVVTASLQVQRNPASTLPHDLVLNGEGIALLAISVDGVPRHDAIIEHDTLTLPQVPERFTLATVTSCNPQANTTLSGLYTSSGNFFTQCEAEGFRRITFFADRPDVMSIYRVEMRADRTRYPVLLSNGNLMEQGDLPDGRHYAIWHDPFPKPCYLFAMVAARLVCEQATLRLQSGREALLQVWVEAGNLDKTAHAMQSLIHSIRWDEQRFGLELDLDRFMIVASNDFNMGAMENKGLNIFNTKYVLANPALATDNDYFGIESVVGHEYFHNWTGNRVTCRDWFQLSLKEGLTVFRDQEFSMDMLGSASGRAVKRIEDVRSLRSLQFPEDAGPMAHPIRPDEYQGIDNFYTMTVYEKGAEVVRMQQTLLGREGFRRGMDEYFRRHDGQAVTCDDFVAAMEAANPRVDLTQFRLWYAQAGTPRVRVRRSYDAGLRQLTLQVEQFTPPTPGQAVKAALHIPLAVGLVGPDGQDLPLRLAGEAASQDGTRVLELRQAEHQFTFVDVPAGTVPSVLREFSAPVHLDIDLSEDEFAFLMAHDSDAFNRWEAGQQLLMQVLTRHARAGTLPEDAPGFLVDAFRRTLQSGLDPAFVELALGLPDEAFIAEQMEVVDPKAIARARQALCALLGSALAGPWQTTREANIVAGPYSPDAASAGKRALRNLALAYLVEGEVPGALAEARVQYREANNMTDRFAALAALAHAGAARDELADFFHRFEHEALAIDKWFALQATARRVPDGQQVSYVDHVRGLLSHPAFTLNNPNRARSVLAQFSRMNPEHFHDVSGHGYDLWAEYTLKLDALNPQIASRLARSLDLWKRYTPDRQALMYAALERVAAHSGLSKETHEVVSKALA
jgi:aminopeptidase N